MPDQDGISSQGVEYGESSLERHSSKKLCNGDCMKSNKYCLPRLAPSQQSP